MAAPLVLFDAVIFDLDGTLVATERFWVAAAMRGAERAFEELGVKRELPSAQVWLSMVGLPLERAFERVFADLSAQQRARTLALCVEEEHKALDAGGAAPMPGAFEALAKLREQGVKLGVASNCSQAYLDAMLDGLRESGESLRAFVREARCLDSARVRNKTDMIADLIASFGTRSVVMVGDRATDAEAAHSNALPHIHLSSGFASVGECVECEATLHGLGELLGVLGGRARWIGDVLRGLDGRTIGVTGRPAAGKSTFARDLVRVAELGGDKARRIALDGFLRTAPFAGAAPDDHLARAFDLDLLKSALLEPRQRGVATLAGPWGPAVAPEERLVMDGIFLADPRLRPAFDSLIHLAAPDELLLRRVAARDPSGAELVRMRRDFLPAHAAFEARFPPAAHAERVLDAENSLGPLAFRAP
jgi:phosphoglycolate phosphatase-like HAD superfamily hydrolase